MARSPTWSRRAWRAFFFGNSQSATEHIEGNLLEAATGNCLASPSSSFFPSSASGGESVFNKRAGPRRGWNRAVRCRTRFCRWPRSSPVQVYLRGSQIRYFILPDMLRHAPMFKKKARENETIDWETESHRTSLAQRVLDGGTSK